MEQNVLDLPQTLFLWWGGPLCPPRAGVSVPSWNGFLLLASTGLVPYTLHLAPPPLTPDTFFTALRIFLVAAGFGCAAADYLSVLGSCSAFVLGIPVSVPESCFDGVLGVAVSVPGSCFDGALEIAFSVRESCSASALEAAVCVLVASFDICSEYDEVASALLLGDFESG